MWCIIFFLNISSNKNSNEYFALKTTYLELVRTAPCLTTVHQQLLHVCPIEVVGFATFVWRIKQCTDCQRITPTPKLSALTLLYYMQLRYFFYS